MATQEALEIEAARRQADAEIKKHTVAIRQIKVWLANKVADINKKHTAWRRQIALKKAVKV